MSKRMPLKKFRAGAISATIWIEDNLKTINLERSYTDKDGAWKFTNELRIGDLPKAQLVLSKAYEFLVYRELGEVIQE